MRMKPTTTLGDRHAVIFEITNTGPVPADNVRLVVTLPPILAHVAGPELELDAGTIRPGGSYKTKLTADVASLGEGQVLSEVKCENAPGREAKPRLRVVRPGELSAAVDPIVTNGCECTR